MSAKVRDAEFDAITPESIFQEARDRLKICQDAESENRTRAKVDLRFREGDQWDHGLVTTASADRPELTINLTDALCQRVENNIKQQRPRGKCHAVSDGADLDIANVFNGLGRHVEARSEASVAYDQGARSAIDNGWGYFRLIAEWEHPRSFRKELRILPIRNVFSVYMDPSAMMPSGQDQNWCLVSIKQRLSEYRRNHPNAEITPFNDLGRDELTRDWQDKEEIRLAEYMRIREKEEKLWGLRHPEFGERTFYDSELPEKLPPGWQIEGSRDSVKRQVEWFELNGLKVIDRQMIPGQWIPVFRVEGRATDIDGKVWRRGMVRAMQDPQRMVNYGEVAKIRRLALTPQAPWVMAEGQDDGHIEWTDGNTNAYPVLKYKPVAVQTAQGEVLAPPPMRQQPAGVEAGFAEFVQGMRTNLLAVAGMPNEPGADKQGEVISGRAIMRRQYLSDQSHFHVYDNLTLAIAQCWRVMAEWFPFYYREPGRMQRIIGEDSTPKLVKLNERVLEGDPAVERVKNDLSIGRYDVVMETGPGYETKREEGADHIIELMKVPAFAELIAKTRPDLIFRAQDYPYMTELADALQAMTPEGMKELIETLPERARSLVQSLANRLQQAEQALQQAQMEQKFGLAKEHMRSVTKAHDTEESNATKRFDMLVRAQTARDVEEIKAGASLLNTHAEAKYHKEEAERMIEAGAKAESGGSGGNGSAR